jgi:DnaJ-class molecular chaperone
MSAGCKLCRNGFLGNRFGQDVECVRGVLIDIDEAMEGWQRDVAYPPAPCEACEKCKGSGVRTSGNCGACRGTGWKSGRDESQQRLAAWAATAEPQP